jgi:membrane protein implicated in regulation of membrane protease activity
MGKEENGMDMVFTVCMVIGFVIPLITLVFGSLFDGVLDGIDWLDSITAIDLDFGIDVGDFDICFLPFSVQSICAGLLVFGAAGKVLEGGALKNIAVVGIAVALGYVVAVLVQTLIRKLKKVENTTYSTDELLLYDAKVVNTIIKGGFGSVSVTTTDGITSTYPAKADDPNISIRQDSIVHIVEFQGNVAIVQEKDLLEKKYDDRKDVI